MIEDVSYSGVLKYIFKYLKLHFTFKTVYDNNTKISIQTIDNKNVWLEDKPTTFESEFDEYFVKDIEHELIYDAFFEYIKNNKKYNIMTTDEKGKPMILLTIPDFINVEELILKLNLILQ